MEHIVSLSLLVAAATVVVKGLFFKTEGTAGEGAVTKPSMKETGVVKKVVLQGPAFPSVQVLPVRPINGTALRVGSNWLSLNRDMLLAV